MKHCLRTNPSVYVMQYKTKLGGESGAVSVPSPFPELRLKSVAYEDLSVFLASARRADFCLSEKIVHIWKIRNEGLRFPAGQLALLSEDERGRASLMANTLLKSRFLTFHVFLRCMLSMYIGSGPQGVCFSYNDYGKPELGSENIFFNLSHSGDLAVAAFSGCNELGVDIERVKPVPEAVEIARNFFSRIETRWIGAVNGMERWKRFLRCWVIREACVKAIGTGLSMPLNSFEVCLPEMTGINQPESFYGRPFVVSLGTAHRLSVREFIPDDSCLGALAVLHKHPDFSLLH
ncbi:4'-phosphopantetheinyl transferase superfamily protein [Maridesulfovibrio sp.]|uniref:4'-phosphopantetheinyl transferase family protein n=1 Tax=Maridesulfovibrio sp. TaxID=2795000 RepID=UPI0029F53691|nr:4'-phosphopantetheinyl transferase superfamily protein [Maridesulfovibrio sp.]